MAYSAASSVEERASTVWIQAINVFTISAISKFTNVTLY